MRVLVLAHVRVIDGTGSAAMDDQTVIIDHGKIVSMGPTKTVKNLPHGAKILDLSGKTLFPGLVGMHEHLFYPLPDARAGLLPLYGEMADSAPRLYLAGGVTSARTAGSLEPYTDISLQQAIDAGKIPAGRAYSSRGPIWRAIRRSARSCILSPTPRMRHAPSATGQRKAPPRSKRTCTSPPRN